MHEENNVTNLLYRQTGISSSYTRTKTGMTFKIENSFYSPKKKTLRKEISQSGGFTILIDQQSLKHVIFPYSRQFLNSLFPFPSQVEPVWLPAG
mgnify:FL=1